MTGEVFAKSDVCGNTVCRAESPKYFWAIIAVYACLALTLIFCILNALQRFELLDARATAC